MQCADVRHLLDAYVDGELPPTEASVVAAHLASCSECAAEADALLRTVRTLRESLVPDRAPDVLRARIRSALRAAPAPDRAATPRAWRAPWRAIAAGLLIAVASSSLTLLTTRAGDGQSALANEVVASHIRSLMPGHLTDVQSSDQHNVKPWFNGRLDYSPAVPRLDSAGFPLIGGRLDYIAGRPVAVVTYGRRQHVINVFSWPDAGAEAKLVAGPTRNGYNLLQWSRGGVRFYAVSDLNRDELRQFVELARSSGAW